MSRRRPVHLLTDGKIFCGKMLLMNVEYVKGDPLMSFIRTEVTCKQCRTKINKRIYGDANATV